MQKVGPSIKRKAKEQADFTRKYGEINPLKKLDWNATENGSYLNKSGTVWGPPYTGGPRQTALCPPLSAALPMGLMLDYTYA